MWSLPWTPWASWSSQDKEPEEVKKQTKAGEGQRSQRGVKYYQRSKSEKSANIDETAGMDKRKVKPPGGAKRASGDQQQGDSTELVDEWQVVREEELQARGGSQALTLEGREMTYLGSELMAGSGPASTLSTDSEAYRTPLSSLSEQDRGVHRGLVQAGSSDSGVILRLQEESIAKDATIRKLQLDVNQLQQRLKYAEQLEEQNLRLTTEESKHEREKQLMKAEIQQLQRKASVSRPYTRGYAHEQKLQELVKRYEQQYNEELEENSRLRDKIFQLEREMQELEGGTTYLGDVGYSDLKIELKKKEQHIHALQTQVGSLQQHSTGQSRQVLQLKQELEALKEENRKLSLDVGGLHRDKHFLEKSIQALKAQLGVKEEQLDSEVRKLEGEKEALQNEVQVAKAEAELYKEEFESEQLDREVAHWKIADHEKKYAHDVGELKAKLAQMEEDVEQLYQRRENEMRSVLEEASKNQQEVQTSQVKQYKKQVDILKTQSMTDSLLGDDSRCPSNRIFCQPSSTDSVSKVVIEGRPQGSVKLEDFQRAMSKEPIEISPAELASLGARDHRSVEKKIQQLQVAVDLKDNEIETLSCQLDQRGQRIEALSKVLEHHKTSQRGLRHDDEDTYLENIAKMTEQLSGYEISDREQKNELVKLRAKVREAETVTEQLDGAIQQMDELETENRMLKEQIARQSGSGAKLSETEEESRRVHAEYRHLEGSYKMLYNDIAEFQQLLQEKDAMIECMSRQLQTYKKTVTDLMKIVEHTKGQSRIVKDFRQQLAKTEGELKKKDNLTAAKDSVQDELERLQELAQSRRDVTQLTTDVEQLRKEKANLVEEVEAHEFTIETFAKETEEWRSACDAERCRREALERRIAELEKVNDQLRQYEFWNIPRSEVHLNMEKFLGTGAWGFVVEGTFQGQRVAVKCLHDMIRSPEFAEVMRKEIAIMAQVRHPNLVLLIAAVLDTKNCPLIVTELLDTSLRKAYEENFLQGSSKLSIFRDIAAALNYLHLRHCGEIIHRDVSSANVLLEGKPNSQWKAKLSDFGSSKLAIEAKTTAPGAPVYSAPEVRKDMGIRHTTKLDVYSYGILLCEVTVEQFPDEESFPSMMQKVQGKWAFMHRLITSCIQDHPDRRPTMSSILSEFSKL